MHLAPLPIFATLIALSLTALGCETRVSLGGRCAGPTDCTSPLVCRFGRCRAECATANDCRETGALCIGEPGRGACTSPEIDTCASSCTDGLVCAGEICAAPCDPSGEDCLEGSACMPLGALSVCVASPAGRDAGVGDAANDGGTLPVGEHRSLCVGHEHVCLLRNGTVHCWGNNQANQLGDGSTSHGPPCPGGGGALYDCASAPTLPVLEERTGALLDRVASIACGEAFTCALTEDGRVLCWGLATSALGVPVAVAPRALVAIDGTATAVTTGWAHACAETSGGTRCWGANAVAPDTTPDRRLGIDVVTDQPTPVVATDLAGLGALVAGGEFTCGVDGVGAVHCHGHGDEDAATPGGRIIEGLSHPTDVMAGRSHGCALADEGLVCWGSDASRQLGRGPVSTTLPDCDGTCRPNADIVVGSLTHRFVSLSHGVAEHTCAIAAVSGEVYCWGFQSLGQCGADPMGGDVDSVREIASPVMTASGPLTGVVEVAVGGSTCALTDSGTVYCWGLNNYGQVGFFEGEPPGGELSFPHWIAEPIPLGGIVP